MDIQTAKLQIKNATRAYLKRDDAGVHVVPTVNQRPLFLVGAPGIGKTAIIGQIAQELGIGMVSYSMTHHTRQSALGLPRIVQHEFDGHAYDASEYTMSEIVSAIYDYMKLSGKRQGILFLDEINCVSETLYPSMLQFLQFKTFGRHRVPEDWVIVCAGNPPEYNKSVHEFDVVTLDRLRELDVEPDYAVWRRYAIEKGIHPAVTSFLEAKPDSFYKVETMPGGRKSFVTPRGWEDLARTISLYELIGIECDSELFSQFIRDEDIADAFSVYYSLFEKYREDYQVDKILEGSAGRDVVERAVGAELDERVALLGLVLDALSVRCGQALDQQELVLALRDELREAKPELLSGKSVDEAIMPRIHEREEDLARQKATGTASLASVRAEGLFIRKMRDIANDCVAAGTDAGPAAFETVNGAYRTEVKAIAGLVATAQRMMGNAIEFVETCFGDGREMLILLAELSTRTVTMRFISHFGSDAYYARDSRLKVDEARENLASRVRDLSDIKDEIKQAQFLETQALDMGSAAGLKHSDSRVQAQPEGKAAAGDDSD